MIDTKSDGEVLADYLGAKKALINAELLKILLSMKPRKMSLESFDDSSHHSVIIGGKRIRPILAIAVYEACGGKSKDIVRAACTLELIHAGSLILDDLPCMDNADLRRGEPTSHKLYGEATTILTSAALWVQAFEILSSIVNINTSKLINRMASTMGSKGLVQGQMLDLASFNSVKRIKDLEECYRLKTGVLFGLSVSTGSLLAGAPLNAQHNLQNFGEQLGIAFQIRDDIIDATQTPEQSGKDAHLDLINHKPTYVSIQGLPSTKESLKLKIRECHELLSVCVNDNDVLHMLTDSLLVV
jgi:geranylgeranyl diphosphate synthase type II